MELRYLPATRTLAKDRSLLVLCDLSYSNHNAVEVAIVSTHYGLGLSPWVTVPIYWLIVFILTCEHSMFIFPQHESILQHLLFMIIESVGLSKGIFYNYPKD